MRRRQGPESARRRHSEGFRHAANRMIPYGALHYSECVFAARDRVGFDIIVGDPFSAKTVQVDIDAVDDVCNYEEAVAKLLILM